jgi:hypothetical protein
MVTVRKPMTATEKELFKEAVIKDYQLKHPKEPRKQIVDKLIVKLRGLIPVEIVIGIGAAALFVYLNDFKYLVNLLLMGVIWATIISAIVAVLIKPR